VRQVFFQYLKKRVQVKRFDMGPQTARNSQGTEKGDVIDGEFSEVSPQANHDDEVGIPGNSGWTKH